MPLRLAVVTATTSSERALDCLTSWREHTQANWMLYVVHDVMGTVPAFAEGVRRALCGDADIIACLHDDLLIEQDGWDRSVLAHFAMNDACGLLGFGGAMGLGDPDIYQKPYEPHQLARRHFISNMRHAEAHGERVQVATQVSCLDGFSQIGRREYWEGWQRVEDLVGATVRRVAPQPNLFEQMADWGIIHHCYDAALGCFAAQLGWEAWMLPVRVHHYGGRTAVGDHTYAEWARAQNPDGDAGFWTAAHRIVFDRFKGTLPLRG